MTKHARFLHIERGSPDEAPESEAADRARIAAVIAAAPVSAPPAQIELAEEAAAGDGREPDWSARAARMIDAPPEAGAGGIDVAIDVVRPEGQPFVRCARCGADSSIHAKSCENCAAPLDTAEQRAFNDRLWDVQQGRSERERAALAQMAEARVEHARNAYRPLPDPGIKPPPELLEPLDDGGGPIVLGALLALREPKWRWIAGALVVGLPLLLVTLGGPILGKLGWILVTLFFLGMLPRSVGRRLLELWAGFRSR